MYAEQVRIDNIAGKDKSVWLRIEQTVQECDATMNRGSNEAGARKTYSEMESVYYASNLNHRFQYRSL